METGQRSRPERKKTGTEVGGDAHALLCIGVPDSYSRPHDGAVLPAVFHGAYVRDVKFLLAYSSCFR